MLEIWAYLTTLKPNNETYMIHQKYSFEGVWIEENLSPFDELMLSWNASRPIDGAFLFYISVKIDDDWSPWLLYASWGSVQQSSFLNMVEASSIKVYQDALEVLDGKKARGFQIKITPEDGALISDIHGVHVYTNGDKEKQLQPHDACLPTIHLPVPGLSQMTLDHIRHKDLCSPTSTTAVTRYLSNNSAIDPVDFAQNVWDSGFDIYGNWVFNVAEAAARLGNAWDCWVERLHGFDHIYNYLSLGTPVIVSVKGPLPGSALPYAKGHLMAVIGYDSLNQKIICMDPGFPTDNDTHVSYDLSDFVQAWSRRGYVAYVFKKRPTQVGSKS